jgi:predicted SAM-dependent methyltransferase
MNKIIQLNIGCGEMILSDYINCDLYNDNADIKCDAKVLPFEDNSVDKIIRKEARRYIGIENINLGMEATKI